MQQWSVGIIRRHACVPVDSTKTKAAQLVSEDSLTDVEIGLQVGISDRQPEAAEPQHRHVNILRINIEAKVVRTLEAGAKRILLPSENKPDSQMFPTRS
jgi:hypothetical protein